MRGIKAGLIVAAALAALPACAQQRIAPEAWFTAADYPPNARPNADASATINYAISAEGRVARCTVVYAGPTSKVFADATCALLTQRARYIPAYDTSGQPTVGKDIVHASWAGGLVTILGRSDFGGAFPASPVQAWVTDDDYPRDMPRSGQLDVPMTFEIGTSGRISACEYPKDFSHPAIGSYTCRKLIARARFEMPRGRNGESLATRGRTVVKWRRPQR